MIGQYLSNTNENATVSISQNFSEQGPKVPAALLLYWIEEKKRYNVSFSLKKQRQSRELILGFILQKKRILGFIEMGSSNWTRQVAPHYIVIIIWRNPNPSSAICINSNSHILSSRKNRHITISHTAAFAINKNQKRQSHCVALHQDPTYPEHYHSYTTAHCKERVVRPIYYK